MSGAGGEGGSLSRFLQGGDPRSQGHGPVPPMLSPAPALTLTRDTAPEGSGQPQGLPPQRPTRKREDDAKPWRGAVLISQEPFQLVMWHPRGHATWSDGPVRDG